MSLDVSSLRIILVLTKNYYFSANMFHVPRVLLGFLMKFSTGFINSYIDIGCILIRRTMTATNNKQIHINSDNDANNGNNNSSSNNNNNNNN